MEMAAVFNRLEYDRANNGKKRLPITIPKGSKPLWVTIDSVDSFHTVPKRGP